MAAEGPNGRDLPGPGPPGDSLRVHAKECSHLGRRQECIRWSCVGHDVRLPFGLSDLSMNVRQRTFAVDGPFGSFFGVQVTSYLGMGRLGRRVTVRSESPFVGTRGGPRVVEWTSSNGSGGTTTSRSCTAMIVPRAYAPSSPSIPPRWARRSGGPASTPTRPRMPPWRTCSVWPGG